MPVEWCRCKPDVHLLITGNMQSLTYIHGRSPIQISQATFQAYSRLTVSPSPDTISTMGSRGAACDDSAKSQCSRSMLTLRFMKRKCLSTRLFSKKRTRLKRHLHIGVPCHPSHL